MDKAKVKIAEKLTNKMTRLCNDFEGKGSNENKNKPFVVKIKDGFAKKSCMAAWATGDITKATVLPDDVTITR